jgi:hypothetical protein
MSRLLIKGTHVQYTVHGNTVGSMDQDYCDPDEHLDEHLDQTPPPPPRGPDEAIDDETAAHVVQKLAVCRTYPHYLCLC